MEGGQSQAVPWKLEATSSSRVLKLGFSQNLTRKRGGRGASGKCNDPGSNETPSTASGAPRFTKAPEASLRHSGLPVGHGQVA